MLCSIVRSIIDYTMLLLLLPPTIFYLILGEKNDEISARCQSINAKEYSKGVEVNFMTLGICRFV